MEIIDPRSVLDFQTTTFCGHSRNHVHKVLLQTIQLGHADYACYWTLELLCSGLVHSLWATFFEAAALHINRGQPAIFLYLASVYERYAPLESKYPLQSMTEIRNNPDVRALVCQVAATLALCRKNKLPSLPTIKPKHDFEPVTVQESLKAPSRLYGVLVLRKDDPLLLAVPLNEIVYCLRQDVRDVGRVLYWMAWVYAYAREQKKQTKQGVVCADRSDEHVSTLHGSHLVWVFWDAVRKQAGPASRSTVDMLYRMYCLRWTPAEAKRRQPLLTAAVLLVCEGPSLDTTPVSGETLAVSTVLNGIPAWIDAIQRMQKSFSP
jgi:hypothetical protein